MTTARLSKSKMMAGLQCPKRLWLEVHRPDLLEYSTETEQRFTAGHQVNDVARSLHADGVLIDIGHLEGNLQETRRLLTDGLRTPLSAITGSTVRHHRIHCPSSPESVEIAGVSQSTGQPCVAQIAAHGSCDVHEVAEGARLLSRSDISDPGA